MEIGSINEHLQEILVESRKADKYISKKSAVKWF